MTGQLPRPLPFPPFPFVLAAGQHERGFFRAGFGSRSVTVPLAQGQGWLKSYPQTGLCSDKACVNAYGANEFIEIARLQTVV